MIVSLTRVAFSSKGVFGAMAIYPNGSTDETPICVTCEDPWNDNQSNISCIPEGAYRVKKRISPKHKNHWILQNVPGRSLVLIHAGNTIDDTHGCILVGRCYGNLGNLPAVLQSKEAMTILRDKLPDEFTLLIN